MKKLFCWHLLCKAVLLTAALSALIALINLTMFDGGTFSIGFPTRFLTIYLDKASAHAFHLSLSSLALDLLLSYAVCWFIDRKAK